MKKSISNNINTIIFWAFFTIIIGCYGFIYAVFPFSNDDWWFLSAIQEFGLPGAIKFHFNFDNTRIATLFGTILLMEPRWISKTIFIFSFIFAIVIMLKLCNIKSNQWKSLSTLSFFIWIAPMWEDAMFSHFFAFNYIVPLPLLFGMIYLFQHPDKLPLWIGVLFGVLLGTWHESYTIVYVVGCILNLIVNPELRDKKRVILTTSVIIGGLWFTLFPVIYTRVSKISFDNLRYKGPFLLYNWIYLIYLLIWLFCYFKIDRTISKKPIQLFALSSGILVFIAIYTATSRANMPGIFICCCAITVLLKQIFQNSNINLKLILSLFLGIFTCSSMISASAETLFIKKMSDTIAERFLKAEPQQKYAFGMIRYPWKASVLALRRPDPFIYLYGHRNWIWLYNYTNNNIMIVPEELQDYSAGKGVRISDNPDVRLWKGHIVSSNVNDTAYHHCHIDYGQRTEYTEIHRIIFNSNDGKPYVYMLPKRSTISTYLGDPQAIELKL